jgi:hypothetical protein
MKRSGKICLSVSEFFPRSAMQQVFSISFAALIFWVLFYQEKNIPAEQKRHKS